MHKICFNNPIVRQELQFGAVGISSTQVEKDLYERYHNLEFYPITIKAAIRDIVRYVDRSTKNLQRNYCKLKKFLPSKDIVSEIIVMGHGLDGSDEGYYSDILIPKYKGLQWSFYWHTSKDKQNIELFVEHYNLKNKDILSW